MLRTWTIASMLGAALLVCPMVQHADAASGDTMRVQRFRTKSTDVTDLTRDRVRLELRFEPTDAVADFDPARDEIRITLGVNVLVDSATDDSGAVMRRRGSRVSFRNRGSTGKVRVRVNLRRGRVRVVIRNIDFGLFPYSNGTVAALTIAGVRYYANFEPEFFPGEGRKLGNYRYDGPRGTEVPYAPEEGTARAFRVLASGSNGIGSRPGESRVIEAWDAEDLARLWQRRPDEPVPIVDFVTERVFFVELGSRDQLSWTVEVSAVHQLSIRLVEIQFTEGRPCGGSADVDTGPWQAIAVERGPPVFRDPVFVGTRTAVRCLD